MTKPTGVSFISYRRSRLDEAELLINAQHDHGIPTWQDITDLPTGPTVPGLRKVLADPNTANALLWVTPDVADSRSSDGSKSPA